MFIVDPMEQQHKETLVNNVHRRSSYGTAAQSNFSK